MLPFSRRLLSCLERIQRLWNAATLFIYEKMGCNVMCQCEIKMSLSIRMAFNDFLQKSMNMNIHEKEGIYPMVYEADRRKLRIKHNHVEFYLLLRLFYEIFLNSYHTISSKHMRLVWSWEKFIKCSEIWAFRITPNGECLWVKAISWCVIKKSKVECPNVLELCVLSPPLVRENREWTGECISLV